MPGAQPHPQPRMQDKKHTSTVTTGRPNHSGIPCAMVLTAYFAFSPVIGLSATVTLRTLPQGLMPASRHQDDATWPYAANTLVSRAAASIASRSQRS